MKIPKILLSGLVAVSLAASASATTIVHVVGSTAYRAPFTKAVFDYLTANDTGGAPPSYGFWGNSNVYKASGAIISGTISGIQVVVETYWTGSIAGTVDLVSANPISNFLNLSTYNSQLTTSGTYLGSSISSLTTDPSNPPPDVAMSDSYYKSVAAVIATANVNGGSGATLASEISGAAIHNAGTTTTGHAGKIGTVGVIPFQWAIGNLGSSGVVLSATNMTQQAAKQLIEGGNIDLSEITPNPSDVTNFVLLVGRNEDSGTRLDTIAESQSGIPSSSGPLQALLTFNNNNTTTSAYPLPPDGVQTGGTGSSIATVAAWPENDYLNTEPTISWSAPGHSGYVSGGDVANVLLAQNPGAGNFTISTSGTSAIAPTSGYYTAGTSQVLLAGYVGVADLSSALSGNAGGNAIALEYNGVPYSAANVENGTYTLWGYEHMYYTTATGTTAGSLLAVINGIADEIFGTDADINSSGVHAAANQAGILYGTMDFVRGLTEGGTLAPAQ